MAERAYGWPAQSVNAPGSASGGAGGHGVAMRDALVHRLRALAAALEGHPLPRGLQTRLTALLGECERALEAAAAGGPAGAEASPQAAQEPAPPLTADAPVHIWCDGSCAPNPGPGGWGAIVEQDGRRQELSGGAPASTNNIMEMTAAIEALRRTPEGARVRVTTDSRYLMDGITKWLAGWKRKGWLTADRKPVKNQAQWKALDALVGPRHVRWEWVESHTGHPENERCDELANAARRAQ